MALRIADSDCTIVSNQTRLAEVDAAISTILRTGQSYTIAGSRSVVHASLADLRKERSRLCRLILLQGGMAPYNTPDFAADNSGSND